MRNSSHAAQTAASILLIAFAFIISWKVVIPDYKKSKEELFKVETDLAAASDKLESLKTAQNSLNALGDTVDKMLLAVPSDSDMPNLITELEALAVKHKSLIPTISVSDVAAAASTTTPPASSSAANAINISFSLTGTFEDLSQFIASIQRDIRYMNIESLSLSAGKEGAMTLSLKLKAFKRINTSLAG